MEREPVDNCEFLCLVCSCCRVGDVNAADEFARVSAVPEAWSDG